MGFQSLIQLEHLSFASLEFFNQLLDKLAQLRLLFGCDRWLLHHYLIWPARLYRSEDLGLIGRCTCSLPVRSNEGTPRLYLGGSTAVRNLFSFILFLLNMAGLDIWVGLGLEIMSI